MRRRCLRFVCPCLFTLSVPGSGLGCSLDLLVLSFLFCGWHNFKTESTTKAPNPVLSFACLCACVCVCDFRPVSLQHGLVQVG